MTALGAVSAGIALAAVLAYMLGREVVGWLLTRSRRIDQTVADFNRDNPRKELPL